MKKNRFAGKSIAVIGFGREGAEVVKLLHSFGASVCVVDIRPESALGRELPALKKSGITFRGGRNYLDNLTDFDIVVRSPGVSLQAPAFTKAKRKGVEITSATKLFFELSPTKKIIGVTGTKGKSTTASLIYHLLKTHLKKVYLAGNIGMAPIGLLPKLKSSDTVVLELSSFQLEDMTTSPHIAVFLNVVPEHLDRHRTHAKYLSAKLNLVAHQKRTDWLVASKDFVSTRAAHRTTKARLLPVSEDQVLRRGVYMVGDEIVYRDAKTGRRKSVAKLSDIKLRGRHMLENVLPALGAALLAGLPADKAARRLATFRPLPHRLEVVRAIGDTVFINDSFATTPEATAAAVSAFSDMPVSLILGGLHKGGDIKKLARVIQKHPVVWISLIGKSARKFSAILKRERVQADMKVFADFETAVVTAYNKVRDEGAVLLSPACASFDMFKNATDRAEVFKKIVTKL